MEENIPDVLSDQIDDPNLPDGGSIGSLDCANVDYDDPHLYRPHAFALRHGDDGAQIAYGELHWRVDTFTLEFTQSTVAVTAHPDHAHDHPHTHTTTSQSTTKSGPDLESTGGGYGGGSGYDTSTPDHYHDITHTHTISQPVSTDTTSGVKETDGSSSSGLTHTVTGLEAGGAQITYCSGAGQSSINNITQQVPNINEKDGEAMDSKLDGVHTFHQLDSYGEVYLCWEVDFEESPNVQKCWVQIGVPSGSVTGAVSIGTDTTGRLAQPPDPNYAVSTYHVHIGTVNLNERVVQKISSDVSWQPMVMDRVFSS